MKDPETIFFSFTSGTSVTLGTQRIPSIRSLGGVVKLQGGRIAWFATNNFSESLGPVWSSAQQVLSFGDRVYVAGAFSVNPSAESIGFLAAYTSEGELVWRESFPGPGKLVIAQLAADAQGRLRLAGSFTREITVGDFYLPAVDPSSTRFNAFEATFALSGKCLGTERVRTGGHGDILFGGMEFDTSGSQYFALNFNHSVILSDTMYRSRGDYDFVIGQRSPSGELNWARHSGEADYDAVQSLALTINNELHFGGRTLSRPLNIESQQVLFHEGFSGYYLTDGTFKDVQGLNWVPAHLSGAEGLIMSQSYSTLNSGNLKTHGLITHFRRHEVADWALTISSATNHASAGLVLHRFGHHYFTGTGNGPTTIGNLHHPAQGGFNFVALASAAGSPPRIISPPIETVLKLNETFELSVIAEGVSTLSYRWFRGTTPLDGQISPTLRLLANNTNLSGYYSVEVSNPFGLARSEPVQVTVLPGTTVQVRTLAGSGTPGFLDSSNPLSAQFQNPDGIAVAPDGSIYVADSHNHVIRRIATGVSTFTGMGTQGYLEGLPEEARFNFPLGLSWTPQGALLIADTENDRIRQVRTTFPAVTSLVAGSGEQGLLDSSVAAEARFDFPNDMVADSAGNIYVTEFLNHTVRKISPNGQVSTLAGNGDPGYVDARGGSARLNQPAGITLSPDGFLYITDWGNQRVRRIGMEGNVTTVAGTNRAGWRDGLGSQALLHSPNGITTDMQGNLYICESGSHSIRRIHRNGYVETLAGNGQPGFADGDQLTARFNAPGGIAVHWNGELLVADTANHRIRRVAIGLPFQSGSSPLLSLQLRPELLLYGKLGGIYLIQSSEDLKTWETLTEITVTNLPQVWQDPRTATDPKRVWRAVQK